MLSVVNFSVSVDSLPIINTCNINVLSFFLCHSSSFLSRNPVPSEKTLDSRLPTGRQAAGMTSQRTFICHLDFDICHFIS
jgi:hypothetical protein